jgi:hypothetical protein
LGDDAGRWFLIGMVANPWVLECRANGHLGTHFFYLPFLNQQAKRRAKLPEMQANRPSVLSGNVLRITLS